MQSQTAYLDNAATTKVHPAAVKAAADMMSVCYGNPSSLHSMGVSSARAMASAREQVAALLGCESEAVYFTSGGSEANNLAVIGGAMAKVRRGKKIVTTAVEHSSVIHAMKYLEQQGFSVTYLAPDQSGRISAEQILDAVDSETVLVSIMTVNNEMGAIYPVIQAARQIRANFPDTLIHTDGVQAFGKIPLRLQKSAIDLMSISGHKISAPKGIGALYIRRGVRILPLIHGGAQEKGLRSGTENLPGIAAFGVAAELCRKDLQTNYQKAAAIKAYLLSKLEKITGICINSPDDATPYIVSLSVPGYRSETMLHFLEGKGVYVSSGSACSKGQKSSVLTAMGLSAQVIDGALRISFIYDTAEAEIDLLAAALEEGMRTVAH